MEENVLAKRKDILFTGDRALGQKLAQEKCNCPDILPTFYKFGVV